MDTSLSERAKKFLEEKGVAYVLLFGSFAEGRQMEESDVDVAVKVKELPESQKEQVELMFELEEMFEKEFGRNVQVTLVNIAPTTLLFEIFKHGKVLYVSDEDEMVYDKFMAMKLYHDFVIWLKPLERELKRRVLK